MRVNNCPSCGAPLSDIDEKTDLKFCPHCGISLDAFDERKLYQVRDEAKIREAEAQEKIRLKELEAEAAEREEKKKNDNAARVLEVVIAIGLAAIGAYLYFAKPTEIDYSPMCWLISFLMIVDASRIFRRK